MSGAPVFRAMLGGKTGQKKAKTFDTLLVPLVIMVNTVPDKILKN